MPTVTVEELRKKLGTKPPDESIRWLNVLVYGEPGVGKTLLAGTALDHKDLRPVLYLDVDGGIATNRHRKDLDVRQVRSMEEAREIYNTLSQAVDWDSKEPSLPFKSIVIDTASELAKLDMRAIMKTATAVQSGKQDAYVPSQREYLIGGERMREIIRAYRDLPCHCFFMCHSDDRKDNANRTTFFPQFSGRLRHDIAGFIDIVGFMYADIEKGATERIIQVHKTRTVAAKDRTNAFPDGVILNPTLPEMWDTILAKQNGKVESTLPKKGEQ